MALATSAYGISFGALSVASGLDIWQTCVLSLVMFTGGSQFAFIGVIGAGGAAAAAAAVASAGLLGVRNVAYGLRMAPVVGTTPMRRVLAPHFTIDESTAVALAHAEPQARKGTQQNCRFPIVRSFAEQCIHLRRREGCARLSGRLIQLHTPARIDGQ